VRWEKKIDRRLQADDWERSSGIIVNTNGWIQDEGYQLLLHSVQALRISVVLIMGHDRLYSMMKNSLKKVNESIKVIKVPRSGGVVQRDANFLRQCRSRAMKRYFYGDMVESTSHASKPGGNASAVAAMVSSTPNTTHIPRVPQLTPFLLQIPLHQVTLYRFASMSLSASLLPVAAAQTTEPVRLEKVEWNNSSNAGGGSGETTSDPKNKLSTTNTLQQNALLAVCHPKAVAAYEQSGKARDLYQAGVAGFCAVERVLLETDMLHLLCPCAGSLPSNTLLLGDVTWME